MHALIDADRLAYAFGGFVDEEGQPLAWPLVAERVDTNIRNIMSGCGADSRELFLTGDDGSNFRIHVATIRPYKGHRSTEKPFWYEQIRRYLIDEYGARVSIGMEADDAIGIEQLNRIRQFCEHTNNSIDWYAWLPTNSEWSCVACSVDKDFNNFPGNKYNELTKKMYYVSEVESLRNFYSQCLTGDPTDNILGLYGIGPKSSLVKEVQSLDSEMSMYKVVKAAYQAYFGNHWKQFLWENAKLLWILRSNNINEVEERLSNLEADSKIESESN